MAPKLAQLFHTRVFKEHGGKLTREERYPSLPLDNPVRMVPLKAISCEAARKCRRCQARRACCTPAC